MIGGDGDLWREYLKRGPEIGERLTVRSIKLYADGAMGSRGAAFFQPYSDDPGNTGLLMTNRETVERIAREAAAHGFQVCTHAIGDRANGMVLDAYAAALGGRTTSASASSTPRWSRFRTSRASPSTMSSRRSNRPTPPATCGGLRRDSGPTGWPAHGRRSGS